MGVFELKKSCGAVLRKAYLITTFVHCRAELFTLHKIICEACLTDWIHLAVLVD
jgi:hypothetical protein